MVPAHGRGILISLVVSFFVSFFAVDASAADRVEVEQAQDEVGQGMPVAWARSNYYGFA